MILPIVNSSPKVVAAAAALAACVLALAPAAHAQIRLPAMGQASGSWFGDNPYAGDSAVHAYVIASERRDRVASGASAYELTSDNRTVVRVLDERGLDYATVKVRIYAPKGSGATEGLREVVGYTHTFENGRVKTTPLAKADVYETRVSDYFVDVSFSLPEARPGSVLDYAYQRRSDFIAQPGQVFFQGELPIREAFYDMQADARLAYRYTLRSPDVVEVGAESGRVRSSGAYANVDDAPNVLTFRAADVPAMRPEPFVTTLDNHFASVDLELARYVRNGNVVDYASDWGDIAKQLTEATAVREAVKGDKVFGEWAAGYSGSDDAAAKVDWAIGQVATRLRWDGVRSRYPDQRPEKLLAAGRGTSAEVNAVLLGLVRALGVDAHPVYLSTRQNGYLFEALPRMSVIDHLVVGVRVGEAVLLADATDPTSALGIVPERDLNGVGLLVDGRQHAFVPLQEGPSAQRQVSARLSLGDDGYLAGEVEVTLRDYAAYALTRGTDASGPVIDVADVDVLDGFAVADATVERGPGYSWVYRARVRSEEPALRLGDGLLGFRPLTDQEWARSPFAAEARAFPVEFPTQLAQTRTIRIELPEGYAARELPESVSVKSADKTISYRYVAQASPGAIDLTTALVVKRTYHTPEDYAGLRELFGVVAKREGGLVSVGRGGE